MKTLSNVIVYLTLLLTPLALAEAGRLVLPKHFEVISINGHKIGGLLSAQQDISLVSGEHLVEVKYDDIIESDIDDSHTRATSDAIAFNLSVVEGHRYQLEAERPDETYEALKFAKKPQFAIKDVTSGQYLQLKVFPEQQQKATLIQRMLGSDNKAPIAAIKPVTDVKKTELSESAQADVPEENSNTSDDAEAQLFHWWKQATSEQRQRFLTKVLSD